MWKLSIINYYDSNHCDAQRAIRRFSGFPADTLPRLRFHQRVASKVLIRNDFLVQASPEKNLSLSFPERQGNLWAAGGVESGQDVEKTRRISYGKVVPPSMTNAKLLISLDITRRGSES